MPLLSKHRFFTVYCCRCSCHCLTKGASFVRYISLSPTTVNSTSTVRGSYHTHTTQASFLPFLLVCSVNGASKSGAIVLVKVGVKHLNIVQVSEVDCLKSLYF